MLSSCMFVSEITFYKHVVIELFLYPVSMFSAAKFWLGMRMNMSMDFQQTCLIEIFL